MTDFSAGRMWTRSLAAAAMVLGLGVGSAMAAPCPSDVWPPINATGPGVTDQATCYAYGAGNPTTGNVADDIILNAGANGVAFTTFALDANFSQPYVFPTIQLIEDVDESGFTETGTGTYLSWDGIDQSGTFRIEQAVPGFLDLLVALKMGIPGQVTGWYAWTIPNVAGIYEWTWDEFAGGGQNSLNSIGLYGVIPLPAAAWLMFAGMGALGLVARRRKAKEA